MINKIQKRNIRCTKAVYVVKKVSINCYREFEMSCKFKQLGNPL